MQQRRMSIRRDTLVNAEENAVNLSKINHKKQVDLVFCDDEGLLVAPRSARKRLSMVQQYHDSKQNHRDDGHMRAALNAEEFNANDRKRPSPALKASIPNLRSVNGTSAQAARYLLATPENGLSNC